MSKVITSAGLNEFIATGKTEDMKVVAAPEAKAKPKEEKKADLRADPVTAKEAEALAEKLVEADGDLMPEETLEQAKAKINKKHRELKAEKALRQKLQEERDENERLAENQFNERRLVETERDRLKRELEELKGRAEPAKTESVLKAPDKADPKFLNEKGEFQWDKFTDAQAEYRVEEFKQAEAKKQTDAERKALELKVQERVATAEKKYPDFREKLNAQANRNDVPPFIMQFLFESEQGPDIAYYFADHYDELTEISKLSPIKALSRLGKLESRFEPKVESEKVEKVEQKAEVKPSAPPPISPISATGNGTVNVDPSRMNFKELRAYEREKAKRN
jgi:hypothetical protein